MQQNDSLVRGQTSSSAGCQLLTSFPSVTPRSILLISYENTNMSLWFTGPPPLPHQYLFILYNLLFIHLLILLIWSFFVHPYCRELFLSLQCSYISSVLCHPTKCQMLSFLLFSPKTFSDLVYGGSSPAWFCFFISWGTTHMVIYCWLTLGKLC